MKILIYGATGMVGGGALREALLDDTVTQVTTIGRDKLQIAHSKLSQIVMPNLLNYSEIEDKLSGFDACLFCLGTQSAGKTEAEYTKVTYEFTIAAAEILSRVNPQMTFIYISGEGADSTEKGFSMWARVRGRTENALLRFPFKAVYIFRPALIRPINGLESKTKSYRDFYRFTKPLLFVLRFFLPGFVPTTETLGRALIFVAKNGADKRILRSRDFERIYKMTLVQ